jgi:hypothetical protein
MKMILVAVGMSAMMTGSALAQGVAQTPQSQTVNQQRQNSYTVSPNSSTQTYPSGNTFGSPFSSPFGTSSSSSLPRRGGYAGSGSR